MAMAMSLRRAYRRVRRQARFHFAVLLTIVAVAYVGVPHVASVVESVGGYNPGHYEPKDVERGAWLDRVTDAALLSRMSWDTVINIALFLLVAVVWLTLVPTRAGRRTPHR
jgi:hypothetical protein